MDVKPDNLGERSDGTLAFLDITIRQGSVCPFRDWFVHLNAEGTTLMNRLSTTMAIAEFARPERKGLLQKKKASARGSSGFASARRFETKHGFTAIRTVLFTNTHTDRQGVSICETASDCKWDAKALAAAKD
jgi:hypothetical protein